MKIQPKRGKTVFVFKFISSIFVLCLFLGLLPNGFAAYIDGEGCYEDGFENGTVNMWGNMGNVTVQSDVVYNGVYAANISYQTDSWSLLSKDVNSTILSVRGIFRFPLLPPEGEKISIFWLGENSSAYAVLGVRVNATTTELYFQNSSTTLYAETTHFNTSSWHWIEFFYNQTSGIYTGYLDGVNTINGSYPLNLNILWVGGGFVSAKTDLLVDNLAYANHYIGTDETVFIFSDDFEDGTYNKWSGYDNSTGEILSVISNETAIGNYSSKHILSTDGYTYRFHELRNVTYPVFVRGKVFIPETSNFTGSFDLFGIGIQENKDFSGDFVSGVTEYTGCFISLVCGSVGNYDVAVRYLYGSGDGEFVGYRTYSDIDFFGGWHEFELKFQSSGDGGIVKLLFDGFTLITLTGVINYDYKNIVNALFIGSTCVRDFGAGIDVSNVEYYIDNLVLAVKPSLSADITYPENITYTTSSIPLDLTQIGSSDNATLTYNVWNTTDWVYTSNITYSSGTTLSGFVNGSYTFYVYSVDSVYGVANQTSVDFSVGIPPVPVEITVTNPQALTYPTSNVPIEFSASGGTIDKLWFNFKLGSSWVYSEPILYNGSTSVTLSTGIYTFWAYANNTDSVTDYKTVTFTVITPTPALPGGGPSGATPTPTPEPTVNIDPATLPINSGTAQFGILVILGVLASSFLIYVADHQKKSNKWKPKDPLKSIPWKKKPKDVKRGEKWNKNKK